MEKDTELYLIKRIKELECENAYLKAKGNGKPFRAEDFKETCTKDDLSQALDNHFLKETGINPADLLAKAKAFDYIQEELQLAVGHWIKEGIYNLYSHRLSFPIMPISKEKYEALRRVFSDK